MWLRRYASCFPFNEVFEYFAEPDCNSAPIPESRRYKNDCREFDSRNRVYISDSSTFEEQSGTQGLFNISPTFVAGLKAE